jgi:hypothetical protein
MSPLGLPRPHQNPKCPFRSGGSPSHEREGLVGTRDRVTLQPPDAST